VEHQIGEQQRDLPAAEPLDQLHALDLHGQPSTELDPSHFKRALGLWQRSGNVSTTSKLHLPDQWTPRWYAKTFSTGRHQRSYRAAAGVARPPTRGTGASPIASVGRSSRAAMSGSST